MWISLVGLALAEAHAHAEEPQPQEIDESEAQPPQPEERTPTEPSRRSEVPRPRPAPRPIYTPVYVPYPPDPVTAPATPPVVPSPRPVIIKQRPLEISPVVDTAPPTFTPAPTPTPAPPAPPVPQPAPAPAASAAPATPSPPAPPASLPPVPIHYAVKGLTEVEGGLNFSYVRLPKGSSATFALNPSLRRFVSDGLAVGGTVELRVIKDGPRSFTILPDAEYNFSFGDGRLYEFIMLGMGVRYVSSGKASATNFVFRPGLGTKLTFGGGLVALGLAVPIAFSDPVEIGLDIMTRYAIFF